MTLADGWELVVGLEVHVELGTRTKMFCGCATDFGGEPNTRVCQVCTGQPGALPVLNAEAVTAAVRLGLALGCDVAEHCHFHRKNYFYPDLAKNYQISQYDVPLCTDGALDLDVDGRAVRIRIERLHMEEDTGKSLHVGDTGRLHGATRTLVDYNRSGIPLLEIVSRPDIRDAGTAQAYLRELQGVVRALGVSDARMEEGSLRCDANVSVRREGEPLGTRAEIKNLNSTRSLVRAIDYEADRQVDVLEAGGEIVLETRHWDEVAGRTETLRRKETVTDYRYFPDPDLVDVHCDPEWVAELRAGLPELPAAARARLAAAGVPPAQAATVVDLRVTAWLDAAVDAGADARAAANWLSGELVAVLNDTGLEPAATGLSGAHLAELLALIDDGRLSNNLAKEVLAAVVAERGERTPEQIAKERGLEQVSDEGELRSIVAGVVADNPDAVASIRDGNDKAVGALMGQVMRATQGRADPGLARELIMAVISE